VRNPRTGERKRAKATAVPRFRAGSDLKAYVSGAKKVPKAPAKKATAKATSRSAATSRTAVSASRTVSRAPAKKTAGTAKKTAAKR
jgi:DNA-binding protein HU-beta